MSTRAYIIPTRNDIEESNILVVDLYPNSSQKNNVYDSEGQTHYIHKQMDRPGVTSVSGNSYVSGSRNTSPLGATALADVDNDTNDDSTVTVTADFGLLAYLRERVNVNPGGDNDFLTTAEALTITNAIIAAVMAGNPLTVTAINTIINVAVAGSDSDLDGTASDSFGSVDDIMRILSGETYGVKSNTILADETGVFLSLAERDALIATQVGAVYYSSGAFLTAGEPGYRAVQKNVLNGAIRISSGIGMLSKLKHSATNSITVLNPLYAYSAAETTAIKLRAVRLDGTNVATTGITTGVVQVYDSAGNLLT